MSLHSMKNNEFSCWFIRDKVSCIIRYPGRVFGNRCCCCCVCLCVHKPSFLSIRNKSNVNDVYYCVFMLNML